MDEKFLDRLPEYLEPGAKIVLEEHYIDVTRDGRLCFGVKGAKTLEYYRRRVF